MRTLTGILAAGLLAGVSSVALAETNGWYVGAEAGVNIAPDENVKTTAGKFKYSTDLGYTALGQAGYGFGPVRVEGELGWRSNGIDKFNAVSGSGSADVGSLMANIYYDFNTGTPWTPFIGVGLGGAEVMADKIRNATGTYAKGNDLVFAYQGIAGVSYDVSQNLAIKADYRYFRTTEASIKDPLLGGKSKFTYDSHAFLVGFTYKFGAPAPTPAPAPAVAPAAPKATQAPIAKSYLVFFDFNKSNITADAQKIIVQAANDAKANKATSISLTGHTDTVGSVKYNQALSLKRGEAVKAALVKLGIPANEISVVGKGKSELLVPTADSVREPQNRRVQIILP